MKFLLLARSAAFVLLLVTGCATTGVSSPVEVTFSGCGKAFSGAVAGVVVGPDLVATVAHGVIQGDDFRVGELRGTVVALDTRTDLALIEVAGLDGVPVRLASATAGEEVSIEGGLSSDSTDAEVVSTPMIRIEEVLGTRRVERRGVELRAVLDEGDSGAGVFDYQHRLVGIVFAVNDERDGVAWAAAAAEVESLLGATPERWECVPGDSRLRQVQP